MLRIQCEFRFFNLAYSLSFVRWPIRVMAVIACSVFQFAHSFTQLALSTYILRVLFFNSHVLLTFRRVFCVSICTFYSYFACSVFQFARSVIAFACFCVKFLLQLSHVCLNSRVLYDLACARSSARDLATADFLARL